MNEKQKLFLISGLLAISFLLHVVFIEWGSIQSFLVTREPPLISLFEYRKEIKNTNSKTVYSGLAGYDSQISFTFGIFPALETNRTVAAILGLAIPLALFILAVYLVTATNVFNTIWKSALNKPIQPTPKSGAADR